MRTRGWIRQERTGMDTTRQAGTGRQFDIRRFSVAPATPRGDLEQARQNDFTVNLLDADHIYGTFADINLPGDRLSWDLSNLYTTGEITAVPEPATMVLLGLASACIGGYVRRRKQQA